MKVKISDNSVKNCVNQWNELIYPCIFGLLKQILNEWEMKF